MDPTSDRAVDLVVLVASAGGLQALTTVLGELPPTRPVPVVVQMHLGSHSSQLVPILRLRTGLDIEWAVDGQLLEAGQVLFVPGRRCLEVRPDGSCWIDPTEVDARARPHDRLLGSLAGSFGQRGAAVVLTGMGRDGSAGVRTVKAAGGVVLAESEETAEHPSMPRAAAEAGADLVLPLHDIGVAVAELVSGAAFPRGGQARAADHPRALAIAPWDA